MSIINEADLQWTEIQRGSRFACHRKALGRAAGGVQLGASLYEIPPGKAAFPYHAHYANEEAIFIPEGIGTLRTVDSERTVRQRDYACCLPVEMHRSSYGQRQWTPALSMCFYHL